MRIAVIYNEPEVSYYTAAGEQAAVQGVLIEAAAVKQALEKLGHEVTCLGLCMPVYNAGQDLRRLETDLVFNLFEGFTGLPGSEADIAAMLAELGMNFTGCPAHALKLCLDKARTKRVLSAGGVTVPDFQVLSAYTLMQFRLCYPCIVKPVGEDASHGITAASVLHDYTALKNQFDMILTAYNASEILVEEYIRGREFNVTVTGNLRPWILSISEIVFSLPPGLPEIITYEAKWKKDSTYYLGTQPVCPAVISEEEEYTIASVARRAYRLTGCRGYARVDMRMNDRGELFVLEVNPNPDISPDSGAALQAKAAGLDYTAFIGKIVSLAVEGDQDEL